MSETDVFWSEADMAYVAVSKNLGVSAFGDTPEAAQRELVVAVAAAVEVSRLDCPLKPEEHPCDALCHQRHPVRSDDEQRDDTIDYGDAPNEDDER